MALNPNTGVGGEQEIHQDGIHDGDGRQSVIATTGAGPWLSLAAGSSGVANGTAIDLGLPRGNHSIFVVASAGVTSGTVALQGSLDNINWSTLWTGSALTQIALTQPGVFMTSTAAGITPIKFVRAAIVVAIVGGTVQANIASS